MLQVPHVDTEGVEKGVQVYCTHTLTQVTLKELRQQLQVVQHLCLMGKRCGFHFVKLNMIELTRLKMLPFVGASIALEPIGDHWQRILRVRLSLRVCSAAPHRRGVIF